MPVAARDGVVTEAGKLWTQMADTLEWTDEHKATAAEAKIDDEMGKRLKALGDLDRSSGVRDAAVVACDDPDPASTGAWESHRRLGEHIGRRLFGRDGPPPSRVARDGAFSPRGAGPAGGRPAA